MKWTSSNCVTTSSPPTASTPPASCASATSASAPTLPEALDEGKLWPYPQIGLNPAFHPGGTIDDLVAEGLLDPGCSPIFRLGKSAQHAVGRAMTLHQHQVDAISHSSIQSGHVPVAGCRHADSIIS